MTTLKKSYPSTKAGILRSAFYLLLLLSVCAIPFALAQWSFDGRATSAMPSRQTKRTLTFADRVAYQHAIEEVHWRHRIWPKERSDPKPSLDAVMSQAQLEKKVEDYLRDSQALEDYWQKPITPEQLQAEMDRMAHHTKKPEVLRELFQALGDDPFVIAECLARPGLAQRLFTELNNADRVKLTKVAWLKEPLPSLVARAGTQAPITMAVKSANYTLPEISSPTGTCTNDTWTATSTTNAPSTRTSTAVWTGSEMIVWGGYPYTNTGGRYDPATDTWTPTSITNAPDSRTDHTAVWTGSEMIVWGGQHYPPLTYLNTGGRYDPSTDTWTATNTANAPAPRILHSAVWTGSEMIVWGGYVLGGPLATTNTGGRYNPSTDSWTATSTTNAPTGRFSYTAIWTGSEMIVWGGNPNGNSLNTGGRYDPGTDSWTATSTTNAPTGRFYHTAIWTGSEMVVWGGYNNVSGYLNTGGRYNPSTDAWTATSTANAPDARSGHTAVWTDSEMIVWGGFFNDGSNHFLNTGGRYDPGTDSWTATSTTNAPTGRQHHAAVWTGSEMIVWGGMIASPGTYTNTGGQILRTIRAATYTDAHSDCQPDTNTHGYSHPNADSYRNRDSYGHVHAYSHSHSDRYGYCDSNGDSHTNPNADSNCNGHRDRDSDCYTYSHADADADANSYSDSNTYSGRYNQSGNQRRQFCCCTKWLTQSTWVDYDCLFPVRPNDQLRAHYPYADSDWKHFPEY